MSRVQFTLHRADCLDVLAKTPACSFDAVITDPPYSINTKSDGQGKLNPWADLVNSAFWYTEWIRLVKEKIKPEGCFWTFLNWRSLVTFQKASCDAKWPIESLLVWDKRWIGPGGPRGLRPSYEFVALFAGDNFILANRGLADIQAFPWSSQKPNGHPAEKPQSLIEFLILNSTEPGGLVCDPFMGSGTTGAACMTTGRRFIGVEIDQEWHDQAEKRISAGLIHAEGGLFSLDEMGEKAVDL